MTKELSEYINELADRGLFGVEIGSKTDEKAQLVSWGRYFLDLSDRDREPKPPKRVERETTSKMYDAHNSTTFNLDVEDEYTRRNKK